MLRLLLIFMLLFTVSTAWAQDEATPEATAPPEPGFNFDYELPPDDVDPELVVGQVGDEDITVQDFRERVRYERFYYYYILREFVNEFGTQILILDDQTNQFTTFIRDILATIAEERNFSATIYDRMLEEKLFEQEAAERDLVPDECAINEYWALLLNYRDPLPEDCTLPPEVVESREEFFQLAEIFANFAQEDVERIVINRAEFDLLVEELLEEADVPDVQYANTRHITVPDEEAANEVLERLEEGEDFQDLLAEYSTDPGATGNRGDLGTFQRGQMIAEFEEAAFNAEVGEFVGPVESQFGFHIIEVLEQETAQRKRVSQMLFSEEADAEAAIRLLENGNDFAEIATQYSEDPNTRLNGGDLGFIVEGSGRLPPDVEEPVFNADTGDVIGPTEINGGYYVFQVTEEEEDAVSAVNARHILVETEEEANEVLERLEEGEDFGDLAAEISIDPSAGGHRGDSLTIFTGNQNSGLYTEQQVPPIIAEAVFTEENEAGDVLGPLEDASRGVFYVLEIQELEMMPPPEQQSQQIRNEYVINWREEQLESERVDMTTLWRDFIPVGPQPTDVSDALEPIEAPLAEAQAAILQRQEETTIPNILRDLQAPMLEPEDAETDE